MTDHLKTIRESINDFMTGNMAALDDLFAALDALEQAMKTPVAWIEHHQGSIGYSPYPDAARQLPDGVRFDLYTAAPPAQQAQAEAAPMSQPNRLIAYSAAAKLRELGYQWDEEAEAWAPQQAEAVPQWVACRCFDEVSKRLCADKNRCSQVVAASAAPQQAEAVLPGHVLVPVEPTAEMKDAAQNRCRAGAGMDWSGLTPQSLFGVAYRAMIDAARAAAPKGQP